MSHETGDFTQITSLQNPRVKGIVRLRERRERDETCKFLIEGYRELLRAVNAGWEIAELYICPSFFLGSNENGLIDTIVRSKIPLFHCAENVFQKISYRDRPDGLLAIAYQKHTRLSELHLKTTPFYIIAEAIEKPGNLGTILRSSDAVGLDGVIVCDRCTDIYNPNVVRASVGTLFTLPFVQESGVKTLEWLRRNQIQILAATPSAKKEFTEVDLTVPVAIAVGTEQLGLSDLWMKQADLQVRIPMMGVADSLNVATATTLLLYEVLRQRRQKQ